MQDSLTPMSPSFHPGNPLLPLPVSVCLSAPALRDEREEPLACDHHHHCDWCHSDCCLGDRSRFAEYAPLPKVQGKRMLKGCKLLHYTLDKYSAITYKFNPADVKKVQELLSIGFG